MAIKRKVVSVSISRTIQITQFHPSTVMVTETAEVPTDLTADQVKAELYKSASRSVVKFMNLEIDKWEDDEKRGAK